MTPKILSVYANAYQQKEEIRSKESICQAYLISRWVWAKKIDIDKMLGKEKKVMTDEKMLEQVKILNAMFGGEVKTVGEKE